MKALTFEKFGTSDVLSYSEVPKPILSENEILIENKALGLNFADIYRRKGNYHLKGKPPYIAGYEGSGIVVETRSKKYKVGDRISYTDVPFANAEYTKLHDSYAIPIPNDIDYEMAASILLQGMTAYYLAHDSHQILKGEIVLIHAASGGVGQILTQLCKSKGAIVIGLSRNKEKLQIILNNGADYAVQLDKDWKSKVMQISGDTGVDVAYDSIGSTLTDSILITKSCGHIIFYGMSGGDPEPIDPRMLMDTSKTVSGGDLWSYLKSEKDRKERGNILFDLIKKGILQIKKPVTFKLSEGKKAHDYLEKGSSSSKVLLIPD